MRAQEELWALSRCTHKWAWLARSVGSQALLLQPCYDGLMVSGADAWASAGGGMMTIIHVLFLIFFFLKIQQMGTKEMVLHVFKKSYF